MVHRTSLSTFVTHPPSLLTLPHYPPSLITNPPSSFVTPPPPPPRARRAHVCGTMLPPLLFRLPAGGTYIRYLIHRLIFHLIHPLIHPLIRPLPALLPRLPAGAPHTPSLTLINTPPNILTTRTPPVLVSQSMMAETVPEIMRSHLGNTVLHLKVLNPPSHSPSHTHTFLLNLSPTLLLALSPSHPLTHPLTQHHTPSPLPLTSPSYFTLLLTITLTLVLHHLTSQGTRHPRCAGLRLPRCTFSHTLLLPAPSPSPSPS